MPFNGIELCSKIEVSEFIILRNSSYFNLSAFCELTILGAFEINNCCITNTEIILIFQIFANLVNRIRISNAPKIELFSNYFKIL